MIVVMCLNCVGEVKYCNKLCIKYSIVSTVVPSQILWPIKAQPGNYMRSLL